MSQKALFFIIPTVAVGMIFMTGIQYAHNDVQAEEGTPSIIDQPQQQPLVHEAVTGGDSMQEQPPAVPKEKPVVPLQAAFAMELNGDHRVLVDKEKDKQLPIASLTKLTTAAVVLERYNLDQMVTISPSAMAVEGSQGQLKLGEQISVKNLLSIMLIESSNRAAQALSEVIGHDAFVALMNEKAAALGLSNTHFDGVTGLSSSNRSSAFDVAKLSAFLYEGYPLFREIISLPGFTLYNSDGTVHHTLVTTNKLLGQDGIIGGKTGWTQEAQGCMMVIRTSNDALSVYVVLGAQDRFKEIKQLIETTP